MNHYMERMKMKEIKVGQHWKRIKRGNLTKDAWETIARYYFKEATNV